MKGVALSIADHVPTGPGGLVRQSPYHVCAFHPAERREVAKLGGRLIRMSEPRGDTACIVHHRMEDSIFIDDAYIVKGIAGALLRLMVEWHLGDGRIDFTNCEMRLAITTASPDAFCRKRC